MEALEDHPGQIDPLGEEMPSDLGIRRRLSDTYHSWVRRANGFVPMQTKQWGMKGVETMFLEERWRTASAATKSKPFSVGYSPWLEAVKFKSQQWWACVQYTASQEDPGNSQGWRHPRPGSRLMWGDAMVEWGGMDWVRSLVALGDARSWRAARDAFVRENLTRWDLLPKEKKVKCAHAFPAQTEPRPKSSALLIRWDEERAASRF